MVQPEIIFDVVSFLGKVFDFGTLICTITRKIAALRAAFFYAVAYGCIGGALWAQFSVFWRDKKCWQKKKCWPKKKLSTKLFLAVGSWQVAVGRWQLAGGRW